MKFARVQYQSGNRTGLVEGDRIRILPEEFTSVVDLIEGGQDALSEISSFADNDKGDVMDLASVTLLPPIDRFRRDILCTGWNYYDHFTEGIGKRAGHEVERPTAPTFLQNHRMS